MLGCARGDEVAARGHPHARPVQRNLFRARLSRAPARHAAGRRPRSHGARRHGVPQDARRPAPRALHPAPPRRRLLRSARTARRFGARRARPDRRVARRARHGVERARHRRARVRGVAGLPAADRRAAHRRNAAAAGGRHLVVGREAGARIRARQSRSAGHQAYLSEPALRAHVRPRVRRQGARPADRAPAQPPLCVRRAGTRAAVAGAGVEIRGVFRARRARAHDPRVRGGHAGWRARDARRPRARRQRSGGRRGVHAARRRRQGHLGAERRSARRNAHVGPVRQVGEPAAPGLHPLAPRRESLLAGPLHRALRKHRAAAAAHAGRAQRRARVDACAADLPRPGRCVAPKPRCSTRCARAIRRACRPTSSISPGAHRRCATGCRRVTGAASSGCSARCRRRWPRAAAAAKSTSGCCCRSPRSPDSPKKT